MRDNETFEHESYGVLQISRTPGTSRPLFGYNIKHQNTIALRISHAKECRQFQNSHYMNTKQIIEVEMSPSQFAEALTSLNVGNGVPVTIRSIKGEDIADFPETDFKETAKKELNKEMNELADKLKTLSEEATAILSRTGNIKAGEKEKVLRDIESVIQEVRSNIPFVHDCFQRTIDETINQAKAEIDTCMTVYKENVGKAAIQDMKNPLLDSCIIDRKQE